MHQARNVIHSKEMEDKNSKRLEERIYSHGRSLRAIDTASLETGFGRFKGIRRC